MNKTKKNKKSDLILRLSSLSKYSLIILNVGLPIILFYLSAFLFTVFSKPDIPSYILARTYRDMLEHIIMSATLIITGAIAVDFAK